MNFVSKSFWVNHKHLARRTYTKVGTLLVRGPSMRSELWGFESSLVHYLEMLFVTSVVINRYSEK